MFPSPIVADKVKPRRHFTRATTKKNAHVNDNVAENSAQRKGKSKYFDKPIKIVDITTPQDESNPTFKSLKRQLKEARFEGDKLEREYLDSRNKLKGVMGV